MGATEIDQLPDFQHRRVDTGEFAPCDFDCLRDPGVCRSSRRGSRSERQKRTYYYCYELFHHMSPWLTESVVTRSARFGPTRFFENIQQVNIMPFAPETGISPIGAAYCTKPGRVYPAFMKTV